MSEPGGRQQEPPSQGKLDGLPDETAHLPVTAVQEEPPVPAAPGWTRRRLLLAGTSSIAALSLSGLTAAGELGSNTSDEVSVFRSRPDLSPPRVSVTTLARGTADGYIFVACLSGPGQRGPMIVDNMGDLVWFRPLADATAANFRVQDLRGRPVLTWWEGRVVEGYGIGEYVLADAAYAEIRRVRAGDGLRGDLHEFVISPQDTALLTAYRRVPVDLSAFGGPRNGTLLDSFVQEVDVASGRVLLDWRARDHIGLDETYAGVSNGTLDPFHLNSIDVDVDGNLLVSARHTWALYKIERSSGRILWRLGGKKSDFSLGTGARFYWQHDAQALADGSITVFDDGDGPTREESASRGIRLVLDEKARTASLAEQYVHPDHLLARAMGSMQRLPDGGAFIGWGTVPAFSEFTPHGELRFDARLAGGAASYRTLRSSWEGTPMSRPALVVAPLDSRPTAFASWNGSTAVAHWRLKAGRTPSTLRPVRVVARRGFETPIEIGLAGAYVAVDALDRDGHVLASSRALGL